MPGDRRHFLGLSLLAALAARMASAAPTAAGLSSSRSAEPLAALRPYLDTLLPGGEAPAASAVGVDSFLLAKAGANASYRRFLDLGCRWLDRRAAGLGAESFAGADAALRERVVGGAVGMDRDQFPRQFFERTRFDAFEHYYAQQAVWSWLGYPGPPQPAGFMDHSSAPRRP